MIDAAPRRLILIRGLPGSGKSTLAQKLVSDGYVHFESDQFFMFGDSYRFEPTKLRLAHEWCLRITKLTLDFGRNVVVANVLAQLWELELFINLNVPTGIVEATGAWRDVHGVPPESLETMRQRWQALPESWQELYLISSQ